MMIGTSVKRRIIGNNESPSIFGIITSSTMQFGCHDRMSVRPSSVGGSLHLEALECKRHLEHPADALFIVDHGDAPLGWSIIVIACSGSLRTGFDPLKAYSHQFVGLDAGS
jgi:hypothetical protein